jgi:hypothetical protein
MGKQLQGLQIPESQLNNLTYIVYVDLYRFT